MEDKKQIPYMKRLSDLENKVEEMKKGNGFEINEGKSVLALALVSAMFGGFDVDAKIAELEKQLDKLETKNEMLEKIVLK